MYGDIPQPPVFSNALGIPPVLVKFAVPEKSQLGQDVEPDVKHPVEHSNPPIHYGKGEL